MIAAVNIDLKQQEIKRTGSCILWPFTGVPSTKTWNNVKQTFKLDLILVSIPSSLMLSVKNRGGGCYLKGKIC